MNTHSVIVQNLQGVRTRIAEAARQAGRRPEDITLVAVTKYVDVDVVQLLISAGCEDFGESRPQELWRKAEAISQQPIRWHQVGHLQRNKVRRTLPVASWIHSVDSQRLLAAIDENAREMAHPPNLLLEVNISGDRAKHGLAPDNVAGLLDEAAALTNVRIRGLMAMAGLTSGHDGARRQFAELRELRDKLKSNCPDGISLSELSMGMSQDYDQAILEGATLVRVGSALFEGVRD